MVLPAYNASKTLEITYNEIPFEFVDDVVLVDDASRDDTAEVAQRHLRAGCSTDGAHVPAKQAGHVKKQIF